MAALDVSTRTAERLLAWVEAKGLVREMTGQARRRGEAAAPEEAIQVVDLIGPHFAPRGWIYTPQRSRSELAAVRPSRRVSSS